MAEAGEICPLAMPAGLMGGRTLVRSSGSGPCPSFVGPEPPAVSRLLRPTLCDTHQRPVFYTARTWRIALSSGRDSHLMYGASHSQG